MAWHVLSGAKPLAKPTTKIQRYKEGSGGLVIAGQYCNRATVCTRLKAAEAAADRQIGVLWIPVSRTNLLLVVAPPPPPPPPPSFASARRKINTLPSGRNTWSVLAWNYATPSSGPNARREDTRKIEPEIDPRSLNPERSIGRPELLNRGRQASSLRHCVAREKRSGKLPMRLHIGSKDSGYTAFKRGYVLIHFSPSSGDYSKETRDDSYLNSFQQRSGFPVVWFITNDGERSQSRF